MIILVLHTHFSSVSSNIVLIDTISGKLVQFGASIAPALEVRTTGLCQLMAQFFEAFHLSSTVQAVEGLKAHPWKFNA